jgi:hypothetical protein
MGALSAVERKEMDRFPSDKCPSIADLRRFVAGTYRESTDEMLGHLGSCDRCISALSQIRKRRVLAKRISLTLAAAAVVVFAIWGSSHQLPPASNAIATVDLRASAPTRGTETAEGAVKVQRDAARLRIILPIGSEGRYDFELVPSDGHQSSLHGSAHTRLENHEVTLDLPIATNHMKPGLYSLALRNNGSDPEYYSLRFE